MKKHKLDKLFSDKLEDYQNQPSSEAWQKLEDALEKQSPKLVWTWIGVAATAVLTLVSSWYILSGENPIEAYDYAYSENRTEEVVVPAEIVLIPVFIQVPVNNAPIENQYANQKIQAANNIEVPKESVNSTHQPSVLLADTRVFEHQLAPVIQEPLPLVTDKDEEFIIASSKEISNDDRTNTLEPLTIIYKQGEKKPVSNFTKAMNYMEDVRNGDKKLLNFKKLGESIKSKFKSSKETNSK